CCRYRIPSPGAWLLQTATMNRGIAPGLFYLKADLDLKAVTIAIFKSCAVHVSPQAHLGNKDGRNPPFHFGRKSTSPKLCNARTEVRRASTRCGSLFCSPTETPAHHMRGCLGNAVRVWTRGA